METRSLTDRWRHRLFRILESGDSGKPLKEAATGGEARGLDQASDRPVVAACGAMGWRAAAKGHLGRCPAGGSQRVSRAGRDRLLGIRGELALARRRLRAGE